LVLVVRLLQEYEMNIDLIAMYICGTLTGIWLSRSYWMTKGASKLYDVMSEKGLLKSGDKA
jgi:hypothetical protein